LVIGTGGSISSHMVLQPQLEGQNHIIKPLWLPGSHTKMALLSADAVKIYDLGKDVISPVYYFLLPSGKVRDATFVSQDDTCYIVIIANDGRIYYEKLDENTSATNGPYYITNDLNYDDTSAFTSEQNISSSSSGSEKKESIGVSIHYSHSLKLLFYTYPNGCSYVGVLEDLSGASPLTKAVLIFPKSQSGSGSGSGRNLNMGLAQWSEVLGHPGLIFAVSKGGSFLHYNKIILKQEI
jgi:E3 ubiquitin-protein ligase UBR4